LGAVLAASEESESCAGATFVSLGRTGTAIGELDAAWDVTGAGALGEGESAGAGAGATWAYAVLAP
jgi:hypothetical protein